MMDAVDPAAPALAHFLAISIVLFYSGFIGFLLGFLGFIGLIGWVFFYWFVFQFGHSDALIRG